MAKTPPQPTLASIETLIQTPEERFGFDDIIDVRTPLEFEEDHIPGAINLPVLSNDERVIVGTLHAEDAFRARRLGAGLMTANISQMLAGPLADKPQDWRPLVMCWRGGNRSGGLATILARIGWRAAVLEGGCRAYRRAVIDDLPRQAQRIQTRTVCGLTGVGKTRLLQGIVDAGGYALDLEGLALHRGSLLGGRPGQPQPAQKWFESQLWDALRRVPEGATVYLESESKKIGSLQVPDALLDRMRTGATVWLEAPLESRIDLLMEEYPEWTADPQSLLTQLEKLVVLRGHEQIAAWREQVERGDWRALVAELLASHYDPSYLRSTLTNYPELADAPRLMLGRDISPAAYRALAESLVSS